MKKLIFLLLAVMLMTACGQANENDQEAVYVNITAEEAKQIMDTEESYIILDVRTQEEYDQGHIPGAILIPNTEIAARAEEILADKDTPIQFMSNMFRTSWKLKRAWWNFDCSSMLPAERTRSF